MVFISSFFYVCILANPKVGKLSLGFWLIGDDIFLFG